MSAVIVNYGLSNLRSLANALDYLRIDYLITSDPREIVLADRLILPGVGAFSSAMVELERTGLRDAILTLAKDKRRPILGICLGMQLLARIGTEGGKCAGLCLIDGEVSLMKPKSESLRIPHYGWAPLNILEQDSFLLRGITPDDTFYFVHSHEYVGRSVVATYSYGSRVAACVENENIFGVQFHLEKSHKQGLAILNNFMEA